MSISLIVRAALRSPSYFIHLSSNLREASTQNNYFRKCKLAHKCSSSTNHIPKNSLPIPPLASRSPRWAVTVYEKRGRHRGSPKRTIPRIHSQASNQRREAGESSRQSGGGSGASNTCADVSRRIRTGDSSPRYPAADERDPRLDRSRAGRVDSRSPRCGRRQRLIDRGGVVAEEQSSAN